MQCLTQKILGFLNSSLSKSALNSQVCAQSCEPGLAIWPLYQPPGPPLQGRRAPPPPSHGFGEGEWLGTVMKWILIQEMVGSKGKSSENDGISPILQCIAAGTRREENSHLSNEGQFPEIDFGWLYTKFAQCSKIQIASERQALALGNIDVFFVFRTFILIQITLLLAEKGRGHHFVFFRENEIKAEEGLFKIRQLGKSQSWHAFSGVRTHLPGWEEPLALNKIFHQWLMTILWTSTMFT